jgi:hypothetical protein
MKFTGRTMQMPEIATGWHIRAAFFILTRFCSRIIASPVSREPGLEPGSGRRRWPPPMAWYPWACEGLRQAGGSAGLGANALPGDLRRTPRRPFTVMSAVSKDVVTGRIRDRHRRGAKAAPAIALRKAWPSAPLPTFTPRLAKPGRASSAWAITIRLARVLVQGGRLPRHRAGLDYRLCGAGTNLGA